jgi:hypothetical protein
MGRKPKYNSAMSSAEKVREHRLRKQEEGKKPFTCTIEGATLERIDQMVDFYCLPNRASLIEDLLKLPLLNAIKLMEEVKVTEDYRYLESFPDNEEVQRLVSNIKQTTWQILCNGVTDEMKDIIDGLKEKHQ